jgi:hypothetical protein
VFLQPQAPSPCARCLATCLHTSMNSTVSRTGVQVQLEDPHPLVKLLVKHNEDRTWPASVYVDTGGLDSRYLHPAVLAHKSHIHAVPVQ